MAVAARPMTTEVPSAPSAPSLPAAATHQRSVNPYGGKPKVRDALNEFSTTIAIGRYRNTNTRPVNTAVGEGSDRLT